MPVSFFLNPVGGQPGSVATPITATWAFLTSWRPRGYSMAKVKPEEFAQPLGRSFKATDGPTEPLPWYPWHVHAWLSDRRAQRLPWDCQGLLRTLIDFCWIQGSIPASADELAEILADDPNVITKLLPPILPWFIVEENLMTCPMLEVVRTAQDAKRIKCRQAGKMSGESRRRSPTTDDQ